MSRHRPIPDYSPDVVALFWSNVAIGLKDVCWEWQAGKGSKGYGNFRGYLTHRVAYYLHTGIQPGDLLTSRSGVIIDVGSREWINGLHRDVNGSRVFSSERWRLEPETPPANATKCCVCCVSNQEYDNKPENLEECLLKNCTWIQRLVASTASSC